MIYIMYPNCVPDIMILAQVVLQIFCSQGCFTTQNDKVGKVRYFCNFSHLCVFFFCFFFVLFFTLFFLRSIFTFSEVFYTPQQKKWLVIMLYPPNFECSSARTIRV